MAAPGLGTLQDKWNDDLREQWWAREGLIQVTMDNRSSGHFGKSGKNYIYGQMGIYEIEDFMAGAGWLRRQPYVDTTKFCLMGYSFGGFITCLGLTYGADIFTHGISYYPVTDWRQYDSCYTERYKGSPTENSASYEQISPIHFVTRYQGHLRIVHGELDDNVHLQHTLQFPNALQAQNKPVEMTIYPGERHGRSHWSEPKRTLSRKADYRFIYENLLDRKMPAIFWQ